MMFFLHFFLLQHFHILYTITPKEHTPKLQKKRRQGLEHSYLHR